MQKIKNEKGITLVVLTITIIVLGILIGVSLNFGLDSVDETVDNRLEADLQVIQQATITEYTKAQQLGYTNSNDRPINFVGTIVDTSTLSADVSWKIISNPVQKYKAYYELTPDDLANLGILNCEDTYILNYYTGEVYNKTKQVNSKGEILYVYSTKATHTQKENDAYNFID